MALNKLKKITPSCLLKIFSKQKQRLIKTRKQKYKEEGFLRDFCINKRKVNINIKKPIIPVDNKISRY